MLALFSCIKKETSHYEMTLVLTGNFLPSTQVLLETYQRGVSRLVNMSHAKASCETRLTADVEQLTLTAEGRRPGSRKNNKRAISLRNDSLL